MPDDLSRLPNTNTANPALPPRGTTKGYSEGLAPVNVEVAKASKELREQAKAEKRHNVYQNE